MRRPTVIFLAAMIGIVLSAWGGSSVARAQDAKEPTVHDQLNTYEPDVKFTDVTLSDALNYLRDLGDYDMIVDWKALEAVNIDRSTLVNLHLHKVTIRRALMLMLNQAGSGSLLTFYVADNVLRVTTQEQADSFMVTMVYPVQDLLTSIPYFANTGNQQNLNSGGGLTVLGGGTAGAGGGGGGLTANTNSNSNNNNSSAMSGNLKSPEMNAMDLIKLIEATIRPDVWKDNNSGGTAVILYYRGNLVVRAPLSVQEAIGGPVN